MPPTAELLELAHRAADAHALWPELVGAIVEQESAWNPWALRYEPEFYEKYVAPQIARGAIADVTESRARAFSWGLMQVMGQVAREHGFTSEPLVSLCDPAVGLRSAAASSPQNSPPPKATSLARCCCGMGQGIRITPPQFSPALPITSSRPYRDVNVREPRCK